MFELRYFAADSEGIIDALYRLAVDVPLGNVMVTGEDTSYEDILFQGVRVAKARPRNLKCYNVKLFVFSFPLPAISLTEILFIFWVYASGHGLCDTVQ